MFKRRNLQMTAPEGKPLVSWRGQKMTEEERDEQIFLSWNRRRSEQGLPPLPPGMRPYGLTEEDYELDALMAREAIKRGGELRRAREAQQTQGEADLK